MPLLTDESVGRILPSVRQFKATTKLTPPAGFVQGLAEAELRERGVRQREQQRLALEQRQVASQEKNVNSLVESRATADALAWRNRPRRPSLFVQAAAIFGAYKKIP
jgi:hypothetical protein